jgi:putative nucleotidyltransferase with HDIG domain
MIAALATLSFALITFTFFIGLLFLYWKNPHNQTFLWTAMTFLYSTIALMGEYVPLVNHHPAVVVLWTKIAYFGVFGFLFAFPRYAATLTGKNPGRGFLTGTFILSLILQALTLFTTLVITNEALPQIGVLHGGKGPLFIFAIAFLIGVCLFVYFQIIFSTRRQPRKEINFNPMVFGLGLCLLTGVLDYLNIIYDRPLILGIKEPFSFGLFIMSLSFADTFFSQFSWVFTAFTRSEREIEKLIEKSNKNFVEFVQLIARTLDAKDHYTAGHSLRVMNYALQIARSLDLPKNEMEMLKQACLLHDIGKIGIPDGILNKRSPLNDKDREHIIRHPVVGRQILNSVADFQGILVIIQSHHERVDGKGYPQGLIREDIPLLARILAVADTYDAISSERPYHKAKSKKDAIAELIHVKDLQLDGRIVDKFIEVIS